MYIKMGDVHLKVFLSLSALQRYCVLYYRLYYAYSLHGIVCFGLSDIVHIKRNLNLF